jgi:putative transposase
VGTRPALPGRREAIAVIEAAAVERGIAGGRLTLGTDNGCAFTSRAFAAGSPSSASRIGAAATATLTARRSSSPGSPSSSSAASGARSSRPSNQARAAIGVYVDSYHDRPHSGLAYRTPREVAQTWKDHDQLTPAA